MEQIKSLDLDSNIGDVTLSNGQSLDIPKLSMLKIIKIVKFLGIDGSKLYAEYKDIIMDKDQEDLEKFAIILESMDEKQLVHIFSIMLDLKDEEVLTLDANEMLEIALVFVDKLDLKKTYSLVRSLMKKMFNKELPESLAEWWNQQQEKKAQLNQMRAQAMAMAEEAKKDTQTDGSNSSTPSLVK